MCIFPLLIQNKFKSWSNVKNNNKAPFQIQDPAKDCPTGAQPAITEGG